MDPLAGSGFKFNENGELVADNCTAPATVTPVFATTEVETPSSNQ